MKVISPLADIDFGIGKISRNGENLVIESTADSTMDTQIVVTPKDARATLRKIVTSGATWRFLVALPFARNKRSNRSVHSDEWNNRRSDTGLNKPW